MHLPEQYYQQRKLVHLVENRTTYTLESAELNIYETHHYEQAVGLKFSQPVLASMIKGKKVMYLRGQQPFDFLPGESIMLPANESMEIDFPDASQDAPTQCLAMTIAPEKIKMVTESMNSLMPKSGQESWGLSNQSFAFVNDPSVSPIIQRLIYLFAEGHPAKDLFVDMSLKELIIRILQAKNRQRLSDDHQALANSHRLAAVIQYIRTHLHRPMTVGELSARACMSESNFHKVFKNEMGMSPIHFINEERLKKAAQLLKNPQIDLREVYLSCGFSNQSYFIRAFKKAYQKTPGAYQSQYLMA